MTYIFFGIAFLLLGARLIQLLQFKRKNKALEETDQLLHSLLNNEDERR
ncbi:hypothetical protein [Brevibacillus daliensis]|nr:hypothetical protein [Brevibacillus daliensis]